MEDVTVDELLQQWEEVYKRGLLSFWILLLLNEREMYAYEMGEAIKAMSGGTMEADDNSVYRALRRFADSGLIDSEKRNSEVGPPRRYFWLTPLGRRLLARFIERNVLVFQQPHVLKAIERVRGKNDDRKSDD